MGDKKERFGGRIPAATVARNEGGLPVPEFPEASTHKHQDARISVCILPPRPEDIAAKYPKALTLADVFAGLSLYLTGP